MNHKLTLCIVAGLLMGSGNANAAYYYCGGGGCEGMYSCPRVVCPRASCPKASCSHRTYKKTVHRKHYYHAPVKRSHYTIDTYYYVQPAMPCGCAAAPCSWCPGMWVKMRGVSEVYYGPYPVRYYDNYYGDDDMGYDFDTRTGDDVWEY